MQSGARVPEKVGSSEASRRCQKALEQCSCVWDGECPSESFSLWSLSQNNLLASESLPSVLEEKRFFNDAAINKEILALRVHCANHGCTWKSTLKDFE
ncbi:TNF receptor-associated factor 1-like, partial [Clarias magur]